VCSIEDISFKKTLLKDKKMNAFLDENIRKRLIIKSGKKIGKNSFKTWFI